MAKKQYRIEIEATDTNITALKAAKVDFTLYETNVVRKSSESFACGSNFATTELLLKAVNEIDDKEYDPQELRNYTANLTRDIPHVMEKIVRL